MNDDPFIAGNTGIAKPIDVLALQEVYSAQTTVAAFAGIMNSLYPGANYQYATTNGGSTGAGTQGLVYNANAVSLVGTALVGTSSGSGQPRQALRYKLRPVGYDPSADFYLYNSHYKAGDIDTTPNGPFRRNVEATAIRANADALGANQNIIYLGDFNVYHDTEDMYQTLLSAGNGQAHDPINQIGDWHNNATYLRAHSQSPYSSATAAALGTGFTDGATGGMDDRFDQQLLSANMIDSHGVAYIPNSYQAFGNNGTHGLNQAINDAANTAQPKNVLDAMAGVLDHVPVVADYQLPAKLGVSVASVPPRVIIGGNVAVNVTVSNAAPVSYVIGADTLSYSLTTSSALSGSTNGTDAALGSGNVHGVTLSTAGTGAKSGSIAVASSSESVASNNFSQNVSYTVVDHSNASFSTASDSDAQTIDFGYVPAGFAARTAPFIIANRISPSGAALTAGLDIDGVLRTGSARMSTDVMATNPASPLGAGPSLNYSATFTPDSIDGDNAATHTIAVSDENIPGATAGTSLVLTTNGRTVTTGTFPVTGFINLHSGETYDATAFAIRSGVTLTKTGPGAINVTGAQNHGAGSQLLINGGAVTLNSDAGGALALTVNSGAAVTFNASQHLASLNLTGGNATITSGGGKVVTAASLAVTGSSRLDLTDNALLVPGGDVGSWNGSAYTGLTGLVAAGRNGGDWSGKGIVTSAASGNLTSLGIDTIAGGAVLVKFSYAGDANLDGKINVDDYGRIDFNSGIGATGWSNGDFNYDGKINVDDYGIIDFNVGIQGPPFPTAPTPRVARISPVPEPATVIPIAIGLVLVRNRRTRPSGF